ncbi:MAG: glutamine-hydrolyzing carbamoyl-phosphate synthase small subunit [Candidatus Marsarchaeota archaeon]|nr:glutamine-hydrolyzing carbamoyl-phosphate synthase small subunit [Candidatus Marsarchaeota archaeon]
MGESAAYIYLEDGTVLRGEPFGSASVKTGELIFTTAMNGYPESLSDPSYKGQVMIMTHPLIGNYGVPEKMLQHGILHNFESESMQVEGLIISELTQSSKWNGRLNLSDWLSSEGIPGIQGIDTRMLTKKVRDNGVMRCVISTTGEISDPAGTMGGDYNAINFVELASPKEPIIHNSGKGNIVVVDCGVKHGILRSLSGMGYNVVRVPYDYSADKISSFGPAGVVYSNGPGNPNLLAKTAESLRELSEYRIPIMGICLGHQMAGLAFGGRVRKMKFGHRAVNKAVVDTITKKAYITTHNHGFAMTREDVPGEGRIWFMSPDDDVVEGVIYEKSNAITTQFHPEARPGTNDAGFIFGMFGNMIKKDRGSRYG